MATAILDLENGYNFVRKMTNILPKNYVLSQCLCDVVEHKYSIRLLLFWSLDENLDNE